MSLNNDLPKYGGTFTRKFNQNVFINKVIDFFKRSEYLAEGACAALTVDWLEFKIQNLGNDFPYKDDRLKDPKVIDSIIQIQAYLRLRDAPLSEFISNFGVERQEAPESYTDFINTLNAGIYLIHFEYKSLDGINGNHVAVCMSYDKNGKHHIELFDAARGDAKFSLNDQNTSQAREWLTAYFKSYATFSTIGISSFSLRWDNSCSDVAKMCKQTNDIMLSLVAQNPHGFWSNSEAAHNQSTAPAEDYTPQS